MFIDTAKIKLKAGNGGNGCIGFHREKYVANGGPDGGDGGRGGNIIMTGDSNLSTLADFRYKRNYEAPAGENGSGSCKAGRSGEDIIIRVPIGTIVKDSATGRLIADISDAKQTIICRGGSGGAGNMHFASATRQAPRFAKAGVPGQQREVTLELKLLADVGLVGFPNAGKSTLISRLSNARPIVASYPFTTLNPILGVVGMGPGNSFVMADIPGIIEGASGGAGLGHEFLKHIERCRMLVQLVDASSSDGRDPVEDLKVIDAELKKYSDSLAALPRIVAINKCDAAIPEIIEELKNKAKEMGYLSFCVSGVTGMGLNELKSYIWSALPSLPAIKVYEPEPEPKPVVEDKMAFELTVKDGVFIVEAPWLLHILASVNMDDYESLQYFQRVLRTSGIIDALEAKGVKEGDTVSIYDFEFEYVR